MGKDIFDLSFGTAGIRGIMGEGPSNINEETLMLATQGVANYLKAHDKAFSAVVCFDTRKNSHLFAHRIASVFSGNGIKTYIFKDSRPTPMLSFAIRKLRASSGVNVTASHNPKEHNGYKLYDHLGRQSSNIEEIKDHISSISSFNEVKRDDAYMENLLEIDDLYIDEIYSIVKKLGGNHSKNLKIVYSPLHGSGYSITPKLLNMSGYEVYPVLEQSLPDPNFSTLKSLNPEDSESLSFGKSLLDEIEADLLIVNDPDSDRVACSTRIEKGEIIDFNGNEIATLLLDYLILMKQPRDFSVIASVVTSPIIEKITNKHGGKFFSVDVGFKNISPLIDSTFLLGVEESLGYLHGDHVMDKDGVIISSILAKMALYWKTKEKNLLDRLMEIYKEFGVHKEVKLSTPGSLDHKALSQISKISGIGVNMIDMSEIYKNIPDKKIFLLSLVDGSRLLVRESGTEKKVNIYGQSVQEFGRSKVDQISCKLKDNIYDLAKQLSLKIAPHQIRP